MKKGLILLLVTLTIGVAGRAQDDKDKVKATSTIPQKVHNTFSKDKKHSGYKSKHTHNGRTTKHKVDVTNGEVKTKTEK